MSPSSPRPHVVRDNAREKRLAKLDRVAARLNIKAPKHAAPEYN
jgi:hypothetical protein